MQARVVVFPVKGRAWCFLRPRASAAAAASAGGDGALPRPPPTLKDLWRGIASGQRTTPEKAEAVVDFVADKVLDGRARPRTSLARFPPSSAFGFLMACLGGADEPGVDRVGERAGGVDEEPDPQVRLGFKVCFGLTLLSRVRPSEVLLKSVTKDVRTLEIVHPARNQETLGFVNVVHLAFFLVGRSCGSVRLQLLVSDCPDEWEVLEKNEEVSSGKDGSTSTSDNAQYSPWNLRPSKELDGFLKRRNLDDGLDCATISSICKEYDLDKIDVLKYRDLP
ncbi:hypothetical protein PR202_gb06247 [Eleusine coracana subsp. coracana]|uniref:Uncharacterized protein n=1 Tax=Eleusine coracana subsp. coracana TaxID=191504 RepID=A0AAV5E974_ELECO|nr:hypothetical protein PR202_gb06247 [Eleusine coracana subsp. coracana]